MVTSGGRTVGVISARDRPAANGTPSVTATTTIGRAANLMRGRSLGCLVVTDHARPVGIVTTADLLEFLARHAPRCPAAGSRHGLSHRRPHVKQHASTGLW